MICSCVYYDLYRNIWEQRPLLLRRRKPQYNEGWFSTDACDRVLREVHNYNIILWLTVQCVCCCNTFVYLQNSLDFSVNIDVTSYKDGERCTHNPDGRAVPQVVWDFFKVWVNCCSPSCYVSCDWFTLQEGCSIRLLNPQTYSRSMWLLTATLQEYFQSFVGANV